MIKQAILLLCAIAVSLCPARAKDAPEVLTPEDLFVQANGYYEKGEYDEAISGYEKILGRGYASGPVYYNLGNAYFKAGSLGKAILNYDRAKRMMPRDMDLKSNYRFASSMVKSRIIPGRSLWQWYPLKVYSRSLTMNELLWISSGAYVVAVILLLAVIYLPGARRYTVWCITLLLLFIISNSAVVWHKADGIDKAAVVIIPQVESRFGPFDSATKFFTLREGAEAAVLSKKDEWCKVRRADGKVGWIQAASIEKI